MLTWEDLKKAKLGQTFAPHDLESCCRTIYGVVAWPGKRSGFAVVMAMSRSKENNTDSYEICLLDEYESAYMRELIQECRRLDTKWEPERWFSDTNDAADEFISEMNENSEWHFVLNFTYLSDMQSLYPYILDKIKEFIGEKSRRLFLKDSKVLNYLREIEGTEISELERGDFPAIEALGYVVAETQ